MFFYSENSFNFLTLFEILPFSQIFLKFFTIHKTPKKLFSNISELILIFMFINLRSSFHNIFGVSEFSTITQTNKYSNSSNYNFLFVNCLFVSLNSGAISLGGLSNAAINLCNFYSCYQSNNGGAISKINNGGLIIEKCCGSLCYSSTSIYNGNFLYSIASKNSPQELFLTSLTSCSSSTSHGSSAIYLANGRGKILSCNLSNNINYQKVCLYLGGLFMESSFSNLRNNFGSKSSILSSYLGVNYFYYWNFINNSGTTFSQLMSFGSTINVIFLNSVLLNNGYPNLSFVLNDNIVSFVDCSYDFLLYTGSAPLFVNKNNVISIIPISHFQTGVCEAILPVFSTPFPTPTSFPDINQSITNKYYQEKFNKIFNSKERIYITSALDYHIYNCQFNSFIVSGRGSCISIEISSLVDIIIESSSFFFVSSTGNGGALYISCSKSSVQLFKLCASLCKISSTSTFGSFSYVSSDISRENSFTISSIYQCSNIVGFTTSSVYIANGHQVFSNINSSNNLAYSYSVVSFIRPSGFSCSFSTFFGNQASFHGVFFLEDGNGFVENSNFISNSGSTSNSYGMIISTSLSFLTISLSIFISNSPSPLFGHSNYFLLIDCFVDVFSFRDYTLYISNLGGLTSTHSLNHYSTQFCEAVKIIDIPQESIVFDNLTDIFEYSSIYESFINLNFIKPIQTSVYRSVTSNGNYWLENCYFISFFNSGSSSAIWL